MKSSFLSTDQIQADFAATVDREFKKMIEQIVAARQIESHASDHS
jgi:hypothetical protein